MSEFIKEELPHKLDVTYSPQLSGAVKIVIKANSKERNERKVFGKFENFSKKKFYQRYLQGLKYTKWEGTSFLFFWSTKIDSP